MDHDELPSLQAAFKLQAPDSSEDTTWYDVQFYPYTPAGVSPVFATLICRCNPDATNGVEVLRNFSDDEEGTDNYCLAWSRATNGDPLVLVTGKPAKIKVLNVRTGELVQTLIGHGNEIMELAVSPVDPTLLASASADKSVRLWTLDPAHKSQPLAAIAYGEGHQETAHTLDFHRHGEYLLSGGLDTRINMWRIPTDFNLGSDKPSFMHYPHFSSTEVHENYVDCVRFHGDLILSRAARDQNTTDRHANCILLWKIDGFDSDAPPPDSVPIPPSQTIRRDRLAKNSQPVYTSQYSSTKPAAQAKGTRSAWGGRFQRLLQFEFPDSDLIWIRFSLFHEYGCHPILAGGAGGSKMYFWDFQRLEELEALEREFSKACLPRGTARSKDDDRTILDIGDPFTSIRADKMIETSRSAWYFREVSWSRGGDWCIACGDHGNIAVFTRWLG